MLWIALLAIGFSGSFLSGLVGVGGAIVMIPLLLYIPPLLGLGALGIKTIAGITVLHVLASSLVGLRGHRNEVDPRLALSLAPAMVFSSLLGALASGIVEPVVMEAVFAILATVTAVAMLACRLPADRAVGDPRQVNRAIAPVTGLLTGFAAGMIGAGGAFLLVPILLFGLRIPPRTTFATSLVVVAAGASAGTVGKILADQIDWPLALALVSGGLPGAVLGSSLSKRSQPVVLAKILGIVVALVAVRVWWDTLM